MTDTLHRVAIDAGATVLGEDCGHYLFSRAELVEFVGAVGGSLEWVGLIDRLERQGVPVVMRRIG
jgi:hypothetical protein